MEPANETSFRDGSRREPFIFVSYAREDCNFVFPEIERLKDDGYEIWYDKEQIQAGHRWSDQIREALEACSCFLVFITKRAVDPERRVLDEIRLALCLKKPLIAVYRQKVKLPLDLQGHLQEIQGLEFYDLDRPTYESQLGRALSQWVKPKPCCDGKGEDLTQTVNATTSHIATGISPKLIFFILIVLGVFFSLFAIVTAAVPFFGNQVPGDPLGNPFAGFAAGALLLVIAIGLYISAFAVYRKHLRKK